MVIMSENNQGSQEKKSNLKIRRPPINSISFPRLGKSKSLLHLGSERPVPPEPDYEEVGPPRRRTNPDNVSGATKKHCDLCGSSQAAVRCDRCGGQAFCLACDDMYHRHPRRSTHFRKAVDEGQVKPPLPPKTNDSSSTTPPPQPPPRKNKRSAFLPFGRENSGQYGSSLLSHGHSLRDLTQVLRPKSNSQITQPSSRPTSVMSASAPSRKSAIFSSDGSGRGFMGSLKKMMHRPLPPPPIQSQQAPPFTQQSSKDNQDPNIPPALPSRPASRSSNRPATAPATPNSRESSAAPESRGPNIQDQQYHSLKRAPPPPPPGGNHRKLSLQQLPTSSFEDKRASLVESNGNSTNWEAENSKALQRVRSQSISDEQWAQLMAAQQASVLAPGQTPQDIAAIAAARRGFSTISSTNRPSNFSNRGMVSSTSVCDLNSMSQQSHQQNQINGQVGNSFQQLNMMGFGQGMAWPPCDMCQGNNMGYPTPPINNGMKRTASNLSMNLSSMGSETSSGYPWAPPPHVHPQIPFYPGYYPPPCHGHMGHGMHMQGSAISIPDSMQSFNKVPPSPAPSVRSSSHRSHKSSKSRSFNNSDIKSRSGNKSRRQSEESEESKSSSGSEDEGRKSCKNSFPSSNLAWQCDHCTFINPGNARSCGMCSKSTENKHDRNDKKNEKRRNERRRGREKDRRTDIDDDEQNISDYDNENGNQKPNASFSYRESKRDARRNSSSTRSSNKYRKKSRLRESSVDSASPSISDIEDEERQLEKRLKELRMSARSRQSDYESTNRRSRDKDRSLRKKEGDSRQRASGKSSSDQSRTSPERKSYTGSSDPEQQKDEQDPKIPPQEFIRAESSVEGTVVETVVSDVTVQKSDVIKSRNKRGRSINSRASTPAPMIIDPILDDDLNPNPINDDDDILVKEVQEIINKNNDNYNYLQVPKKSPKPDTDEPPSFANTLDEIASMRSNEMADIDPSSQALDDHIDDVEEVFIPELSMQNANNIVPLLTGQNYGDIYMNKEKESNINQNSNLLVEPSYELMGENEKAKNLAAEVVPENKPVIPNIQEVKVDESIKEDIQEKEKQIVVSQVNELRKDSAGEDLVSEVVARLSIGGSSSSGHRHERDREANTPLSHSSSDALFYSPPDSPDISLTEKLQGDAQDTSHLQDEDFSLAVGDSVSFNAGETTQPLEEMTECHTYTFQDAVSSGQNQSLNKQQPVSTPEKSNEPQMINQTGSTFKLPTTPPQQQIQAPLPQELPISQSSYQSLPHQPVATQPTQPLQASSSQQTLPTTHKIQKSASDQIISQRNETDKKKQGEAKPSQRPVDQDKDLNVQQLIQKRKQETMKQQGMELVQAIREAEVKGFTPEDFSVAMALCGTKEPVQWLEDNWRHMLDTVVTLATNYGAERLINDVGNISLPEAKIALRTHKGNIWAAVTECVEQRQKKFNELKSRGDFNREKIIETLEKTHGDVEIAFSFLKDTNKMLSQQPRTDATQAEPTKDTGKAPSPTIQGDNLQDSRIPQPPSPQEGLSEPDEIMDELENLPLPRPSSVEVDAEKIDENKEIENLQNVEKEDTTKVNQPSLVSQSTIAQPTTTLIDEPKPPTTPEPSKKPLGALQKASAIVGFAISKAMARDNSKDKSRETSPQSPVTPTQSPVMPAHSPPIPIQSPVTPTPTVTTTSTTPASTPDLSDDQTPSIPGVSDSEDDDLLRTLDTIPEEEEISEMTESGRLLSRSSSKNGLLPFNATSIVKLIPMKIRGRVFSPTAQIIQSEENHLQSVPETPEGDAPSFPIHEDETTLPKHDYYNTTDGDDEPVTLTPNDYEMMYDVKKNLEEINDTNSSVNLKINSIMNQSMADGIEPAANNDINKTYESIDEAPPPPPRKEAIYAKVEKSPSSPKKESIYATVNKLDPKKDSTYASVTKTPRSERLYPSTQVEGLKSKSGGSNYEEVRELKEQIQQMRKELQSQMDNRTPSPENPGVSFPDEQNMNKDELQFNRTVRRLLAEGQSGSYEKAELAAQLIGLEFDEDDCVNAAEECDSIYSAIHFLQQECELCAEKYPMGKMVPMLHCIHRCCNGCAKTYFTFQLKHKSISEVRCPFCNEPDLDNAEIATEYFNNLDILLKSIIDPDTHELFQRKLRDFTLMKDPNFKWCNKCSSGFITNSRSRKLICPDCKDVTCAQCRKPWEVAHDGISCDDFALWQAKNDTEMLQAQGVAKHLAECGITCPKCRFTFALAKGGCMHFTCTQCKFEFCSGCGEPFKQGTKCKVGPYCEKLGLHAHHPRNCLFYLRDKEPSQLEQLLQNYKIDYESEVPEEYTQQGEGRPLCRVPEQKEMPDGLVDDICGRTVVNKQSGLCRLHYIEYLVEKINSHKLDPVNIFDEADLRVCLRRNGKAVPIRRWESEKLYRDKLIKLIQSQLPLK